MPNNDLISRKDLLFEISTKATVYDGSRIGKGIGVLLNKSEVLGRIEASPAVDAEPVRYGKLNVHTVWHTLGWGEIFTKFECCGFEVRGTKKYNYCPNCGAKMEKEE